VTWIQSLFYLFSAAAVFSASRVIMARNPVQAVLFLILTFFMTSGLWMLLEAEFLAVTLVLVYVGAVMVLFLFVVMMLDVEVTRLRTQWARYLPIGLLVSAGVIFGLIAVARSAEFGLERLPMPASHTAEFSHVKQLGTLLYTQYLYPFEIAGILLLVAIVAAIHLTFRGRHGSRSQNSSQQIAVRKQDRVRLVKGLGKGKTA